jgi:hypothetical protein
MRVQTIRRDLYQFDELPENVQDRIVRKQLDCNVDHDWWDLTYEDAEQVSIKITESDTYRRQIDGCLTDSAEYSIEYILANHGEQCDTCKTAKKYQPLFIADRAARRLLGEEDWEDPNEELTEQYLREILKDYLRMLTAEFDYLTSDEAIIETIKSNEWEFDEEGEIVCRHSKCTNGQINTQCVE